ncbi:MAG: hypothetical protein LBT43_11255 [Prevotella sp.]|nr:hypothetical protein [Prevotella sp.]
MIRIVEVPQTGGNPAITNDWLNLYSNPTVSGSGRSVAKHPAAFNYDWGRPEELSIGMQDNSLPVNARNATGKTPIKTTNNLYVDDTGRYWVAVGPNVMNPNFNGSNITDKDMQYGTKIDIVVSDESTNTKYYIPAVVGDAKEHSAPDGVYQTGVPFDSDRPTVNPGIDRNTVEFIGYEILDKYGNYDPTGKNSSVNITDNYKLIELIVYDGIYNYK